MTKQQKFDYYLSEMMGFNLVNTTLNEVRSFAQFTGVKIPVIKATYTSEGYITTLIYRWNKEFDLLEVIHFSLVKGDLTRRPGCLFSGSFPATNYRISQLMFYASSEKYADDMDKAYRNSMKECSNFNNNLKSYQNTLFGVLPLCEFKPKYAHDIMKTMTDIEYKHFEMLRKRCVSMFPYLSNDYPWITFAKDLSAGEKFYFKIKTYLRCLIHWKIK